MEHKGLVLQGFMLGLLERGVLEPLALLVGVGVVVAGLDVLGDGEDVGVLRGEGAHAVDGSVDAVEFGHAEGEAVALVLGLVVSVLPFTARHQVVSK